MTLVGQTKSNGILSQETAVNLTMIKSYNFVHTHKKRNPDQKY